ncbi:ATP-dependent sacrificial sulfur transferase LarE [Phycisphaera mikurensis]|uniref:Uncharacterized protein n=1 Tax=Phycisphaera mikurensis (strain NBRC 102666 / KCTC 22515 / FYK2301M01) TaxID=1142394 RepID=I0IHN5_PHYMF|nr:ATP-dependent sacrificial sulfur transferase LarE [Phycisphaera mikurensis]MBB6441018.1 uncharacterized protein [Phycisphaera mikurensis]BAM04773.1 hypothetical protein PSMK_26140 [Phycisphaera mikurensis NBRC 102666]
MPPRSPERLLADLEEVIRPRQRLLTAFSGGVDSTVVAAAARRVLGKADAPVAVGDSASLPRRELAEALKLAAALDLEVHVVRPDEQSDPGYVANAGDRCYFCKTHLYRTLHGLAGRLGIGHLANGTNADDPGDHRPGLRAADEAEVVSPLLEAGLDKAGVRAVAHRLGLPNADKPAAACLASRIAHHTPVTAAALNRVEAAEDALLAAGFKQLRVRDHGEVARLEVPLRAMPLLLDDGVRERVVEACRAAGYAYVSLDLEGFRSGSGNVTLTSSAGRKQARSTGG